MRAPGPATSAGPIVAADAAPARAAEPATAVSAVSEAILRMRLERVMAGVLLRERCGAGDDSRMAAARRDPGATWVAGLHTFRRRGPRAPASRSVPARSGIRVHAQDVEPGLD